jgi:hypothetical protein
LNRREKMPERFDVEKHLSEAIKRSGGAFKLTALIEKRMKSLLLGSQKLVDINAGGTFETAFAELLEGKIEMGEQKKDKAGG